MDYNILREFDIRGNFPNQINKETTRIIGKSFGVFLKHKGINKCIIGHDNRISSEEITTELIESIKNSGIDIVYIGLVTTPMFNFASIKNKIPYGIMVTASHNVYTDNGFKIFGEDYLHLKENELKEFYKLIKLEEETYGTGSITNVDIMSDYVGMITSKFPKINKKAVIDCGNGTASIVAKKILSKIFLDINYINSESDGTFPIHNPDPNVEENLKWLKDAVKVKKADIGIAFDGDCDRVGIIDEKGNMIPTDHLLAILADDIIPRNTNKNVIIDVKCSCALEHELKRIGANSIMVRNGSAYIETITHDTPALLGGEYSGHIFLKDNFYGFDDGIYVGLRIAELLQKNNKKCSELTSHIEKYFNTPEIRLEIDDNIKDKIVNEIKDYCINQKYDCNFKDGVRVNYEDGFSLIRKSNTGPFLTLRFEAKDEYTLQSRKNEFLDKINEIIK